MPNLAILDREFTFSEREFQFLTRLASTRSGIVLSDQKHDMVYGRLVRRLRALGLDSFAAYCTLLQSPDGAEEIEHLVNAITTNLTHFFRETHHFEHLRDVAVPEIKNRRVRLWSAGCSTGMEPYSMAMILQGAIPNLPLWDAKILATDIDSKVLESARMGEYSEAELTRVLPAYRKDVLPSETPGRAQMSESLKHMIAFKQLNLLESWSMSGPFDAIFCRNVVIYFDKQTKQSLFNRMADLLKPGGWLYIGHSETMSDVPNRFELVGRTVYQRVR